MYDMTSGRHFNTNRHPRTRTRKPDFFQQVKLTLYFNILILFFRVLTSQSCENFVKQGRSEIKLWYQRRKERDALFTLPAIASLYPEK